MQIKAFERLWNFEKNTCYFQTNWISCTLYWGVPCDVYEWRRPHVLLLFVSSSNFSSNWRTSLTAKIMSASANKYSSLIQAIISFIFEEIYAPKVTFSVLWIERTWWIKSTKEKLFKCLFIESYEVSNDTVIIRLQKDTYGRDFNLECVVHTFISTCNRFGCIGTVGRVSETVHFTLLRKGVIKFS